MSEAIRKGAIGELIFFAKAIKYGHDISTPVIDVNGYDCILSNKTNEYRVQIKLSTQVSKDRKAVAYRFKTRLKSNNRPHFFVFYILPLDVFYIVPTDAVAGEVKIYPTAKDSKYHKYKEAWHYFK